MKCLLCGEPVLQESDGRWVHVFTGRGGCTYKAHL